MQGVDVVIVGVGIVAVIATVLGVAFYEEAAGIQEVSFEEIDVDGTLTDSASGGAGQHDLTFDLPHNATTATGSVTVTFTGQAGQGGTVNFDAWFIGPNNTQGPKQSGSFSLGNGATSGSADVELPQFRFADVPAALNTTDRTGVDETMVWGGPLTLRVEITNPGDPLIGTPGGLVTYTYDIDGEVELTQYRIIPVDIPDPQAGQ